MNGPDLSFSPTWLAQPQGQGSPAPAPAAPAPAGQTAPAGADGAEQAQPGGFGMMLMPLLLVGMLVFMFWSNSRQQKKQKLQLDELKKGDRVVSQSGLIGKLIEKGDRVVTVEIASGVKVKMLKSALVGRDAADVSKSDDKDQKK